MEGGLHLESQIASRVFVNPVLRLLLLLLLHVYFVMCAPDHLLPFCTGDKI